MKRRTVLAGFGAAAASGVPGRARAQAAGAYKIGITFPLTGPLGSISTEYIPGAQLAVDEINRTGGVKGHPLELVVEDTQATPQGGVAAMRKVAQVDGVQAAITIFTNVVTAQMPLADQLHLPTLSNILTPGLVSRSQFSFVHQMKLGPLVGMLQRYWRTHNVRRVFAVLPDNAFGQQNEPLTRKMVEDTGATFGVTFLDTTSQDFRGVAIRIRDFAPDAIYIAAQGGAPETTAIRQIRELGITAPMYELTVYYQEHNWRLGVGPYAEKMFFVGVAVPPGTAHKFIAAYRAKTGFDPDYNAAELYDMIYMYAHAIAENGYTGDGIRAGLLNLKGVPSVFGGTITMGSDHYTVMSEGGLWQVRNGRLFAVT